MFNPIGVHNTPITGGGAVDPRIEALQQIKQMLRQLGVGGPGGGGLKSAMSQLSPEERTAFKQLMMIARGAQGGGGPSSNFSAGPMCAPPPPSCGGGGHVMPMMPSTGMPTAIPGASLPQTIPMTRGDAVASKVAEAGDRLEAATGIRIPTQVIDDGVKNGTAFGDYNTVHTGINPDAAPGVKFHEDAHILHGDTVNPQGTTLQRELRADQTAGYLLVKAGYGQKEIEAFIKEVMGLAGGDHGTPDQRAMAVIMGVNQGLAEKGLPPLG